MTDKEFLEKHIVPSDQNIVVIGANGSGKTILANSLKKVLIKEKSILITAQKILFTSPFK